MRLPYRKVSLSMPHCPICHQMLWGDNSMISPYRCECGTWKSGWMDPMEYELTPKPKE